MPAPRGLRPPSAFVFALAFAFVSAGCVLAPIQERALAKVAEQLPMPPGVVDASVHTGCHGSCFSLNGAFATVVTHYPNGTDTRILTLALVEGLKGGGWNVTSSTVPDNATGVGHVAAQTDAFATACDVSAEAFEPKLGRIECTIEHR